MNRYSDVMAIGARGLSDEKVFGMNINVIYTHYPLHNHDFFEIGYILSGSGTTVINGVTHTFEKNSLFLNTNTDFHEIFPQGECKIMDIHIKTDWISPEILNSLTSSSIIHNYDNKIIDRMYKEYMEHSNKSDMYLKHLVSSVLIDCIGMTKSDEINNLYNKFSPQIGKAICIIHSRFSENLTLDEVAEAVELSPNYLSTKFHNEVKVSFQTYLLNKRLDAARKYLIATPCSVTDLCFFSGFNNYINFCKAFKKKFNMTPTQYRSNKPL